MPNPTIPNFPPQGIQAQLNLLYLYNPDVANELMKELQAGLIELNELKEEVEKALKDMQGVLRYKGSVETEADLPTEGNVIGDVWNITSTDENVAWDGEKWDKFGSAIDVSAFATNEWVKDNFINSDASTYTLASLQDAFSFSNARLYKIFNEDKMPTKDTYTLFSLGWTYNDSNNAPSLLAANVETGKLYYYQGTYDNCNAAAWKEFASIEDLNPIKEVIPSTATAANQLVTEEDLMTHTDLPAQEGNAGKVLSTNGVTPEWIEVETGLPDQAGHTGFLQTDGETASWSDKTALVNNTTSKYDIIVGNNASGYGVAIGASAQGSGTSVSVGSFSKTALGGTALGHGAQANNNQSIAIGASAKASGTNAIQLGGYNTNSEANTFKVSLGNNDPTKNYKLLDSDGTIPAERLAPNGTEGQVLVRTATGMEWEEMPAAGGSDDNGLEGDYATRYGIVDETKSGLPYIKAVGSKVVVIPAQLVLDVPGVPGLTTNTTTVEYEVQSTNNPTLFFANGTVIEAVDVFWTETEPENGTAGYAAWWNGTTWQFKSNDTGNVWRPANAVRLTKTVFTGDSLTRLCFTGCRVLNKQEFISKDTQTLNIDDDNGNKFSYSDGTLLIYSETAANPVGKIGAQGTPLAGVYTQQINGLNVPDAPATGDTPTLLTEVAHDTTLAGAGTSASPLTVGTAIQNELSTLSANVDSIYEELGEKLDSTTAASTYATKEEVGNIATALNSINGEDI